MRRKVKAKIRKKKFFRGKTLFCNVNKCRVRIMKAVYSINERLEAFKLQKGASNIEKANFNTALQKSLIV